MLLVQRLNSQALRRHAGNDPHGRWLPAVFLQNCLWANGSPFDAGLSVTPPTLIQVSSPKSFTQTRY
jgi:hypothetical protein